MSTVKERQLKAITHVFRANYDHSRGGIYAMNKGVFKKIIMTICLLYDSRCPFNHPLPTPVVCSSKLRIIKPDRSPLSAWQRVVLGPWRESNLLVLLIKLPTEVPMCCSTTEKRCAASAYIHIYMVCWCANARGDQG